MKQELLVISIILIIIGAVIWSIGFPAGSEAAANAIGQVFFWVGIVLFIVWAAIIAFHSAKGDPIATK